MTSKQLDIIQEAFDFLGDNGNQYDFIFKNDDTFIVNVVLGGFRNGTLQCRIRGVEIECSPNGEDYYPFSETVFWHDMFCQLLGTYSLLLNERISKRKEVSFNPNSGITPDDLQKAAIAGFIGLVEERAEATMLSGHKLEGAHYAAMKKVAAEMGIETGEVKA